MVANRQDIPTQLAFKIRVPKNAGSVIRRQRLIDLLHRNLDAGVQTVCAPAGYGKTTLLADFCSDLEIPVCWYSMDSSDSDVQSFVRGVVASIRQEFPSFGSAVQTRTTAGERGAGATQLADAVASDMRRDVPDYFLLVLEDYHLAEGSDVDKLIGRLVEQMPECCHVVISSRTKVSIPAIRTRTIRGQAFALTALDLAFSRSDIKDLLAHQGTMVLSDELIDRLARDSEGWIVGLLLQIQGMLSGEKPNGLRGLSREDVFSYLASEVYEHLPADVQNFLLRTSVLEQLEPEFCDRLLGTKRAQKLLREVQRRNLFLTSVQTDRPCYRFHPLFRGFLHEKLSDYDPQECRRLHAKSAVMLKEERRWQEAIGHFMVARRYSQARDVLKTVGQELLDAGKWTHVSGWIDALPARYRLDDGELLLLRAQCSIHTGAVDEAARALTQVIAGANSGQWLQKARALSWRSAVHRLAGNLPAAVTDIKASISLLERNDGPPESLGDAYGRLGNIHVDQGNLIAALRHLKRALRRYSPIFATEQTAAVHNSLGVAYRELGNLAEASMHLELARQGWQRTGNTGALASLLNNLGLVYQCQGDYDLALKTFRAGLQNARESGYRRIEACLLISIADLLRDVCLYDEALSLYEEGLKTAQEVMEIYYVACAIAGMGETRRLLGENGKAEILLKQALSLAEEHGRAYEAALFSMRLGVIEYERGEYGKALSILGSAASRIKNIGDKEALARTCFHMAQTQFLSRHYAEAKTLLSEASRLADELGYDAFFAIEGKNSALLLQYAASEGIGGERFVRALEGTRSWEGESLRAPAEIKASRRESPRPNIEVYAFGEGRVLVNGREVADSEWRSTRALEMFFYLLSSDKAKTREQIAVDLWPDLSPAKSTSNFHISLYRARHALFPGMVTLEEGRYRIPREVGIWFDAAEFSHTIDSIRDLSTERERKAALLQRAVDLYTGPFLPDVYSEWAEDRRRQLEGKYVRALRMLAIWHCERGDFQNALAILQKIAALDAYSEDLFSEIEERILSHGPAPAPLREFRRYLDLLSRGESQPADTHVPQLRKALQSPNRR